jgi:hypothetical protein
VRVSLKSVAGVDGVEVSLEKGLASVKMKPGNTATFKQLQEAITKNGFTMKPSHVTVAGKIAVVNGQAQLQVSGSNEVVDLVPESKEIPDINALAGKAVLLEGTLKEAAKGKVPDAIRYKSMVEEK